MFSFNIHKDKYINKTLLSSALPKVRNGRMEPLGFLPSITESPLPQQQPANIRLPVLKAGREARGSSVR